MAKQTWLKGAVIVIMAALVLSGCSKRAEAQEGGSGGGSSRSSVRESPTSDFSYGLTEDGRGIKITGYTGTGGDVVIPSRIEDMPVLEIGQRAFANSGSNKAGLDAITSIVIPNGVEVIGNSAFSSIAITSLILPNTVRKIGDGAFSRTAITRFDMPDSVTEIGAVLFEGCNAITEIHLSDNIVDLVGSPPLFVPASLFSSSSGTSDYNRSLRKINLPKNLKRIGHLAFNGLSELTELVIPDTLESVEFGTFDQMWTPRRWTKEGVRNSNYDISESRAFEGCGKLPLATRAKLESWGYTGRF